uniref:C-CAP/cofactor C-like domain-containing protein n=1 Tax=Gongylonema pulchrum TaxID=637853 RepID=A0A183DVK1_9BILA
LIKCPEATIEADFLYELSRTLTVLPPGYQSRCLTNDLNLLRNRIQAQVGLPEQSTTFSFSTKEEIPGMTQDAEAKKMRSVEYNPLGPSKSTPIRLLSGKSIIVKDKQEEEIVVNGEEGEEVIITGVNGCVIRVPFKASSVHVKSANCTTLIFAPVKTSVLVRDCVSLTIAVAAQQVRIHNSHRVLLYVEVRCIFLCVFAFM